MSPHNLVSAYQLSEEPAAYILSMGNRSSTQTRYINRPKRGTETNKNTDYLVIKIGKNNKYY
jgi:hypothetical protein